MTVWGRRLRSARTAAVIAIISLLASCALAPGTTPAASGTGIDLAPRVGSRFVRGDGALALGVPPGRQAQALMDLAGHATPGGPVDDDQAVVQGQDLVILGDPVTTGGIPWLRVYPVATISGYGDVVTWILAVKDGQPTVATHLPETCPPTRDNLSTIAGLDAFTRVRCLGGASFTVEGRTSVNWRPVAYQVDPAWLGAWGEASSSFGLNGGAGAYLEVRVPPGLEPPPWDITVRATVHVADPASRSCTRRDEHAALPAEGPTVSRLWCTVQVVAESWTPLLGAEGLPFDASAPQLHRFQGGGACTLAGWGPMTFRLDAHSLDPVWLQPVGSSLHLLAWWGPEFRVAFKPDLVVVDGSGQVVARDGQVVDPDGKLAGHFLCVVRGGLAIS